MTRISIFLSPLLLLLSACAATLPPVDSAAWVRGCATTPIPMPTSDAGSGPLLFATTRLPDCRNGAFTMSGERSDIVRLGWYDASGAMKPGDPVTPNMADEDDWWSTLGAQLVRGNGRVLLFVHGYNNNFASPAVRLQMLRIAGAFRGPAILFAWPSQNSVLRYPWDETNIDWTQAYLNVMIRRLARDPAVQEIVLVGHSMGSRSVIDAMEVLDAAGLAKVKNVVLASPDVDRDRFSQIIQGIPGRAGVVSGADDAPVGEGIWRLCPADNCGRAKKRRVVQSPEASLPALHPHQSFVERLQKAGAIDFGERRRTANGSSVGAQIGHDGAGGDGAADAARRERLAIIADHPRACLQTAVGEQYVSGHHDRVRPCPLRDPVVGRIEAVADHHPVHQRMSRNANRAVADDRDRHFMAKGDAVDFVLHRTGIGVDEDAGHG